MMYNTSTKFAVPIYRARGKYVLTALVSSEGANSSNPPKPSLLVGDSNVLSQGGVALFSIVPFRDSHQVRAIDAADTRPRECGLGHWRAS